MMVWRGRSRSHIAPDQANPIEEVEQGQWANLPPELLLDIIQRVEASETSWPARTAVLFCASVCRSWREATKEIVQTPEQCGRLTFPISLKQVPIFIIWFATWIVKLGSFDFLSSDELSLCMGFDCSLVRVIFQSNVSSKGIEQPTLSGCSVD